MAKRPATLLSSRTSSTYSETRLAGASCWYRVDDSPLSERYVDGPERQHDLLIGHITAHMSARPAFSEVGDWFARVLERGAGLVERGRL